MEELKVGDIIKERYELARFLGSGSFGEVWLAQDLLTGRNVAIKIYLSLDPAGIDEFKQEYTNTIDLSDQHLLTPDYFDVYNRRPFLVMKYCEKGSSSKLAGNISEEQLWQFVEDVANGLNVLHNQPEPIVHQDIKPDNILVDLSGRFLITDFGISKRLRATMRRQSKRNVSSGAMPYMAPERFDSTPRITPASDIWSLGASIYELATGELPFSGLGGAIQRNGADMPSICDRYSPTLNRIMQRCLESNASLRPTTQQLCKWAQNRSIEEETKIIEDIFPTHSNKSNSNLKSRGFKIIKYSAISIITLILVLASIYGYMTYNIRVENGKYVYKDNIKYEIVGGGQRELIVVGNENARGDIDIPNKIFVRGHFYYVVAIAKWAFLNCDSISSVSIPNTVQSIGLAAFSSCDNLKSINIPNTVTNMDDYAFANCNSLTNIVIPNSISTIQNYTFSECRNLNSITLPNSITSIGSGAFSKCNSLTSILIPNSVTSIGEWAFMQSENLKSVVLPNSIISIGKGAFAGCTSLTEVIIPNTLTSIIERTFDNCSSLKRITLPNSIISIGEEAFIHCESLVNISIPSSVTSIGKMAFYGCSGLTNVEIPNSVNFVGDLAFSNCSNLSSVSYPERFQNRFFDIFYHVYSIKQVNSRMVKHYESGGYMYLKWLK